MKKALLVLLIITVFDNCMHNTKRPACEYICSLYGNSNGHKYFYTHINTYSHTDPNCNTGSQPNEYCGTARGQLSRQ